MTTNNFIVGVNALCLQEAPLDAGSNHLIDGSKPMWEVMPPAWVFNAIFSQRVKIIRMPGSPYAHLSVSAEDGVKICEPGDWLVQRENGNVDVVEGAK